MSLLIRFIALAAILFGGSGAIGFLTNNPWIAFALGFAWGVFILKRFGPSLLPEVYGK